MSAPVPGHAFLERFTCLGAKCEDTCCKGWTMQVDEPTYERYQQQAPELIGAVAGESGARSMKRDARTDCCVKFDQGLCGTQNQYGADFLSDACYSYPRMTRKLGDLPVMTAALSCPEIARLMLESDAGFEDALLDAPRLPQSLTNVLPATLTADQAIDIHRTFLQAALNPSATPERNFMRIFATAQSLEKIDQPRWAEAVPFYLGHADGRLLPPRPAQTDPFFLLQALCGLVAATKKLHQPRLAQVLDSMQQALHVTIRWDDLAIMPLPDSIHASEAMHQRWREEWSAHYAPWLRRYVAAQLSLALFPFAGFGDALGARAAIIGVRFATVKLALMSACRLSAAPPGYDEVIRIIQSLSRFMDHLSEPEFSLKIYRETGWLDAARLRALVGDTSYS